MSSDHTHLIALPSNKPMVKVLFLLGIIICGFWVSSFFPDLVLTLIVSILSAFILRPIVALLEFRFGIRRILSVSLVFILVGGGLVITGIVFIPIAIDRHEIIVRWI